MAGRGKSVAGRRAESLFALINLEERYSEKVWRENAYIWMWSQKTSKNYTFDIEIRWHEL